MKTASKPLTRGVAARSTLINLSGYQVTTYRVSLAINEPDTSAFKNLPLRSAEDVSAFALKLFPALELDADREHFVMIAVNNKHRLCGLKVISTGSMTASLVHPREVYHAAIVLRAAAVIFMHNHPSGSPSPSPEDIDLTKRLKEAGDLLSIRVLDHVVIGTEGRWFSFNDKQML